MKLPLSWLSEYVDPGLGAEALADRLALTGTAVEAIHLTGARIDAGGALRVGRVLEAGPHPNADRLRLCLVDVGEPEPSQIVCAAPNVAAGQTVAVALPGARLPGAERPLGVAMLRGVESRGMILSETELGIPPGDQDLGRDGDGILVLAEGPAPGTPLREVLPAPDAVLELELTPNRPDCLAVYGMAREVHAVTGAPLTPLRDEEPPATGAGDVSDHATLVVEAPELCPRYMARVLTGVVVGPSPPWLRARLEAAGMRAISNVVDVTNYVMLLTGQPLHAFDVDRVAGARIVVRRARPGEPIVTLDDRTRVLGPSMLAICDAERPAVVAGIMGAADVEVSAATTRVLLEAATFDGPTILATSQALGLRSESSGRFEKGLPPELAERGMAVACRMLVDCGATLVPGTLDAAGPRPATPTLALRHARVDALLGMPVHPGETAQILRRLGCAVHEGGEAHRVTPPFERRSDLTREVDLVEEVGRVHGLEAIPALMPRVAGGGGRTPAQRLAHRLAGRSAGLGLSEAITYRFVPEADADRMRLPPDDPRRDVVRLANPLSEEMGVMRRSLLPGLLRAAARNQAHQRQAGALFEVGRTYAPRADGLADEREWLAALRFGAPAREHWRAPPPPVDVHAARGLADALAAEARVVLVPEPNAAPYFHPVRQARLRAAGAGDDPVAFVGEVHPLILRAFDVTGPAVAVVIDLGRLLSAAPDAPVRFAPIPDVPVSTRDLAAIVPEDVPAAEWVALAREAGAPLVRTAEVFDRYAGAQVEPEHVSLALRLTLLDPARTLTDAQIDAAVERVREALRTRGARMRE